MDDCVFCKIMQNSLPSYCIYEDEDFKAILDINPSVEGHCLLVPKKHAADIFELNDKVLARVFPVTAHVARAVNQSLHPDGINIVQNNGKASGQTVGHFHVHVIPRYHNDRLCLGWDTLAVDKKDLECMHSQLKEAMGKQPPCQ